MSPKAHANTEACNLEGPSKATCSGSGWKTCRLRRAGCEAAFSARLAASRTLLRRLPSSVASRLSASPVAQHSPSQKCSCHQPCIQPLCNAAHQQHRLSQPAETCVALHAWYASLSTVSSCFAFSLEVVLLSQHLLPSVRAPIVHDGWPSSAGLIF